MARCTGSEPHNSFFTTLAMDKNKNSKRMNDYVASFIAMLLLLSGCTGFEVADEDSLVNDPGYRGAVIGFSTLAEDKTRAANEMFANYGVFAQWSGSGDEWYMDHVQ